MNRTVEVAPFRVGATYSALAEGPSGIWVETEPKSPNYLIREDLLRLALKATTTSALEFSTHDVRLRMAEPMDTGTTVALILTAANFVGDFGVPRHNLVAADPRAELIDLQPASRRGMPPGELLRPLLLTVANGLPVPDVLTDLVVEMLHKRVKVAR